MKVYDTIRNTVAKKINYHWLKSAVCCSFESLEASAAEPSDLGRPGPAETLTIAGLSNLSPRINPRRNSSITIPSLNSLDSSRAIAS